MKQEHEQQLDLADYQWVWTVRSVRTEPKECVPMKKGDRLYISTCDPEKVTFQHRGSAENSQLWKSAVGRYDADKRTISGTLEDKTTFEMKVAREGDYHRITCEHRRNPPQGWWDADDEPTR